MFVAVEICLPTGATYGSWGRQALREILGAAVTIGVIGTCRKSPNGVVCRTLSMRPLVFAGVMSYSLYLIHAPVLRVVHLLTPHILIIGIPAALAVAYVFYLLVEKPCIALNRKRTPAT
jgi:peptidoglycan/LPS O-acetylase OafA/YrhL